MRVVVIGAGPSGLIVGSALSARGHEVTAVDRDPGPEADGTWHRRGVMQFAHAHGFRQQVPEVLSRLWPAALSSWLELGAEQVEGSLPNGSHVVAVRSRRSTFERALRRATGTGAPYGPRIRFGHVDGLIRDGRDPEQGRVTGVVVDGDAMAADLVVDASGRSGRRWHKGVELEGDCGISYVQRNYRLRPGADPGPLLTPIVWAGSFDGYQALVFVQERGHFSVVFVRPTTDAAMKLLHQREAFEAGCRAVPGLAAWTDADRAVPTSDVLVGGALRNVYRPQPRIAGIVAVGDAVTTTTPTAGRGVAMACLQVQALVDLVDDGAGPEDIGETFDGWCEANMRPWVRDHVACDTEAVRLWQGGDIDLAAPLTSTRIIEAAQVDSRIAGHVGGYLTMTALPESLGPAERLASAVYATGWRAPWTEGPSRDELLTVVEGVSAA